MDAEQFALQIKKHVIDANVVLYREMYESVENSTDPYGRRVLEFYRQLNASQKEVLFELIRQTAIDTVSSVFGIIDGSCSIDVPDADLTLSDGSDQLSGELQDAFLVLFED